MESAVIPLSILLASFLGSWHCAGMCGPMAAMAASHRNLLSYNFGRLIAYVTLGALAGYAGQSLLDSKLVWLNYFSIAFIAGILIINGLALFSPKLRKPYLLFESVFKKLFAGVFEKSSQRFINSGLMIGLLSGLLPCGWLYSFVIASASTKSAFAGATTMFLFWLGTVPALSSASLLLRQTLNRSSIKAQKISGIILIIAGFYALAAHFFAHKLH